MKSIRYLVACLAMIMGIGLLAPVNVSADNGFDAICAQNPDSPLCSKTDLWTYVIKITNTMMIVLGALSVIMIIYGGIQYVLSAGDAKKVESAKNTILYSVIGLIVAILAGAIVNFVTGVFK